MIESELHSCALSCSFIDLTFFPFEISEGAFFLFCFFLFFFFFLGGFISLEFLFFLSSFFFNNNERALFLNVLAGRLETFNSLFHVQIEVVN